MANLNTFSWWQLQAYRTGIKLAHDGGKSSYDMCGLLQVTKTAQGDLASLAVPGSLVCGVFEAMNQPGAELLFKEGQIDSAVTVFDPKELAIIGVEKLAADRGRSFNYSLGRLLEVKPDNGKDGDKAWVLRIHAPELKTLRRSHGFSALPGGGRFDFHLAIAVRRGDEKK